MEIPKALTLGVVQGLTEFLPVSSSGHLVIVENLIGFESPGVLFESVLHAGTLLAVLVYYRKTIFRLSSDYLLLIGVGTIPILIMGFLLRSSINTLFESTLFVGIALIVTGFMNLVTHNQREGNRKINNANSFFVGLFQAVAILPGVSRSGSTIFAARQKGIQKPDAVRFSFLLSIPAIIGANVLQIVEHDSSFEINTGVFVFGFISAALSGYFAISLVLKFINENKFKYFAYYAFLIGVLTTILSL